LAGLLRDPVRGLAAGAGRPIGYLVFGGSQWWDWGQLTPLPLILLAVARAPDDEVSGIVFPDTPWGPP
jgi:hypothetical protein